MNKLPLSSVRGLFLLASGFLATPAPSWAHHSLSSKYDGNKPLTLTGVVTKIEWANPHFHFYIDAKDAGGKAASWKFEGYAPGVLTRNGWRKDVTMKVGDTVTVFGWQALDNINWGLARQITFADGKKLYAGPPPGGGGKTPPIAVAR